MHTVGGVTQSGRTLTGDVVLVFAYDHWAASPLHHNGESLSDDSLRERLGLGAELVHDLGLWMADMENLLEAFETSGRLLYPGTGTQWYEGQWELNATAFRLVEQVAQQARPGIRLTYEPWMPFPSPDRPDASARRTSVPNDAEL